MTVNYREAYGIFASPGILFNHESPLRGPEFVTRKISIAVSRIAAGLQKVLELGNLGALRDWGYAAEYVEGMWRVLQAQEPDTYVLATNRAVTVRDYATLSFKAAGIDIDWVGTGEQERGVLASNGATLVRVNPAFYRPSEVEVLISRLPSFSDGPESIGKDREFGEHRGEPFDQRQQSHLRHCGDQFVEHTALPE
jgi:GDPmannose 4,6-dehydratase